MEEARVGGEEEDRSVREGTWRKGGDFAMRGAAERAHTGVFSDQSASLRPLSFLPSLGLAMEWHKKASLAAQEFRV